MSILVFGFMMSLLTISLVNLFKRLQTKAEIRATSLQEQRMIAAAREKAWRENKQPFHY